MKRGFGRTLIVLGVALLLFGAAARMIGGFGRGRGGERERIVVVERGAAAAPAQSNVRPERTDRAERAAQPAAGDRRFGGFGPGRERGHGFGGFSLLRGLVPLALLGLLLFWPRIRSEARERGWLRRESQRRMVAAPAGRAAHCPSCGRGYERRPDPWDDQLL